MQFISTVLSNIELSPGYWRMRLSAPQEFLAAKPGQFFMAKVSKLVDPLLRRPFGIFDIGIHTPVQSGTKPQAYFEMLYHAVGKATNLLSLMRENETLDILGPLGSGLFEFGDADEEKLIVGGGIGLAPLYLLAKEMVAKKFSVQLFAGGRSAPDVLCYEDFQRLGIGCNIATDDGSLGEQGLVTKILTQHLEKSGKKATIYACGPHGMLKAVAKIAAQYQVACQVSLENYMACGVGACLGCVTPGKNHSPQTPDYRCVCTEGPVFATTELQWRA